MTDISQGQDTGASPGAQDVDSLFPKDQQDVDTLFPADVETQKLRRERFGASPIQDLLFSNDGPVGTRLHSAGRMLDAFGQGIKRGWGAEPLGLSDESTKYLKDHGVFNDYAAGHATLAKAANEVLIRPAVMGIDAVFRAGSAAVSGLQAVAAEKGEEAKEAGVTGPSLWRDIAALPEAFPTFGGELGRPHPPATPPALRFVEQARDLKVIGEGEAGYLGTALTPEPKAAGVAEVSKTVGEEPKPEQVTGEVAPKEQSVSTAVSATPEPAPPAPDIHAVAREVDPETFKTYDALDRQRETFREHIEDLRTQHEQQVHADAQHNAEIEQLTAKIEDPETTPRLRKKYQASLKPLLEERDAYLDKNLGADTADMAVVRKRLQETDYQMRDLAPKVSQAYREARERVPEQAAEAVQESAKAAAEPVAPAEHAPEALVESKSRTFKTAKGSTYEVHDDGTTTRNKSFHPEHGEADQGAQPRSAATFYVSGEDAIKLAEIQAQGGPKAVIAQLPDGRWGLKYVDGKDAGKFEKRTVVSGVKDPSVGLTPVEVWKDGSRVHFGNEITEVGGLPAKATEAQPTSFEPARAAARASIIADVSKKLIAAGRPAEEANAAAAITAAYWESRAERFGGLKGTAAEMYQAEAPEIKRGKAKAAQEMELAQEARGRIRLREEGRNTITLLKDANASTFIHETGHDWLDRLMKDAKDGQAPAELRADADTVLNWLGAKQGVGITAERTAITTSQHEKFARGFETYMREGRAPTQALADVFAKFRDWLVKIYRTTASLKAPINDDIRAVFDRMLAAKPEKAVIAPEREIAKDLAERHEAHAEQTPPEKAAETAGTVQVERDNVAVTLAPEEQDVRLKDVAETTGRREARVAESDRAGNAPEPDTGEGRVNAESGAVGKGGSEAAAEGARPLPETKSGPSVKSTPPETAGGSFDTPNSPLVDKAGNIRIDNLKVPEDVARAIRDAAEANNEFFEGRRGVITDGQVVDLADALGMDAGMLSTRKLGEAFNAEQIVAARKLLIQSATNVRDAMVKAAEGSDADVLAYAEIRERHRMIQEHVAGITAEAGRALRAFRALEGSKEAQQIGDFLQANTGKTLYQLRREAQLGSQLESPAQVSRFVHETGRPTLKDMVIEAWMAFLLSGLKTHAANIMGNSLSAIWRPVETATAAGIGKARSLITGSEDRVLMGEAAAEMFGMVQGSREGIVAAYKAFKTEDPQFTGTRQIEQQHGGRAIPSATVNILGREMEIGGKQLRIPLRLLTAEDELFKGVAFRGDINRQAYAIAAKEGLTGEQLSARTAELSMSPTEAMVEAAKKVAEYQTFQTPLGKTGRAIQQFANSHILAKLVVPFVRTPLNLLKYATERTPLGLFAQEVRDNLSGKNGAVARDTQIARMTLGTMIGVTTFEYAAQGLITGGGPANPQQKAVKMADGWQPYSIRIGDMYYAYNRLDPFSVMMGIAADTYEIGAALDSEDLEKQHLLAMVFAAFSKNVTERAALKGPSDLNQMLSDPERYGFNYIKGFVQSAVPAIVAQTAQTHDPIVRETRTVIDGLKSRIPYLSETLMPKRDIWGEPITREGGLGPDIASPILERRMKNDPVNKALIEAGYFPGKLDRKIRGVELTDQQYDDYARVAGRMAKTRLNAIVQIPGFAFMPRGTREELMRNTINTSRETARSMIMMQSPDIIKKAMDAKVGKLRGDTVH